MERLAAGDLYALIEAVRELDGAPDLAAFPGRVLGAVRALLPCDYASYNEVEPGDGRVLAVTDPPDAVHGAAAEVFGRYLHEHPVITHHRHTGDGQALRISDFLSQRQFHNLGLYQELYRHTGIEYQMAAALTASPRLVVAIAFGRRAPDFTNRERILLNMLRPHLVAARRTAEERARLHGTTRAVERALLAEGRGLLVVSRSGDLRFTTRPALQWLEAYFGRQTRTPGGLPDGLAAWHRVEVTRRDAGDAAATAAQPYVVDSAGRRLTVRLAPGALPDEDDALVLEERPVDSGAVSLAALGLSAREIEVLNLVRAGKTNVEAGRLLHMSPRTVQKHLEHVYLKLGVRTRTAAADVAFRSASVAPHLPAPQVAC